MSSLRRVDGARREATFSHALSNLLKRGCWVCLDVRAFTLLVVALLVAGCTRVDDPAPTTSTNVVTTTPVLPTPTGPPVPPIFDGTSAFDFAVEQVLREDGSTRYRIPGTLGNDEAAAIIAGHLESWGWIVQYDSFTANYQCNETSMHNVVAEKPGPSGQVVILGAHYDTRPIAEDDPDPEARSRPIPGAGDGASGVAVLLELGRVLPQVNDTVRLVFFDAEDGGDMGDGCTDWIIGSTHYAESMTSAQVAQTKAMVLVDMVGDPNLVLPKEGISRGAQGAPVQKRIYEIGAGLGYAEIFTNDTTHGYAITDDHKPFHERGIPAVDLIHLVAAPQYFPAWHHTQQDDLSNVSPASLEAVGRTLEVWLRDGATS